MMTHYDHPARIIEAEGRINELKTALKEALEEWEAHASFGPLTFDKHLRRIQELRTRFLGS